MTGSIIATQIDNDYRKKKVYESKNKEFCKGRDCEKCNCKNVCTAYKGE